MSIGSAKCQMAQLNVKWLSFELNHKYDEQEISLWFVFLFTVENGWVYLVYLELLAAAIFHGNTRDRTVK